MGEITSYCTFMVKIFVYIVSELVRVELGLLIISGGVVYGSCEVLPYESFPCACALAASLVGVLPLGGGCPGPPPG